MRSTKAASRYAKSLLDLAIENGVLDKVNQDMIDLVATCNGSKDLLSLLRSPLIDAKKKISILEELFAKNMDPMSIGFIKLINKNGRENILPEIAESFIELYKVHNNILDVTVVSATVLESAVKDKIIAKIKENFDGTIEFHEEVDSSLIGGFIVKMGDTQVDTSIARQLSNLNNILLN